MTASGHLVLEGNESNGHTELGEKTVSGRSQRDFLKEGILIRDIGRRPCKKRNHRDLSDRAGPREWRWNRLAEPDDGTGSTSGPRPA